MGAVGVKSPFENVSVDDQRTGEFSVEFSLVDGANVDDEGAGGDLSVQVGWFNAIEALTGGG